MVIREVFYGTRAIAAVYKGTELIWDHGCSIKAVMAVDADLRGRVVSIRIVPVTGSAFADAGADVLTDFIPGMPLSGSGAVTAGVDGTAHIFDLSSMKTDSGAGVDAAAGITVWNLIPMGAELPVEVGSRERVTAGASAEAAVGNTGVDARADTDVLATDAKWVDSQSLVNAMAEPEVTGGTGGILDFGENDPAVDTGSAQEVTGGKAGNLMPGSTGVDEKAEHRVTGGNAGDLKPEKTGVDAKAEHRVTGGIAGKVTPGSTGADAKADHRVTGGNAGVVTPGSTGVYGEADHHVTGGIAGDLKPEKTGVDAKADHRVMGGKAGNLMPGSTGVYGEADHHVTGGIAGRIRQDAPVDVSADGRIAAPEPMPVTGSMSAQADVTGILHTPPPEPLTGELWFAPDGISRFSVLPPMPVAGEIPADADASGQIDTIQPVAIVTESGAAMELHAVLTVLPIAVVAGELCVDADAVASVSDSSRDWLYPVFDGGTLYVKQASKIVKGD